MITQNCQFSKITIQTYTATKALHKYQSSLLFRHFMLNVCNIALGLFILNLNCKSVFSFSLFIWIYYFKNYLVFHQVLKKSNAKALSLIAGKVHAVLFTVRRSLHGICYSNSVRPSVRLSVRLSACHTRGLCPHGSTYDHDFFTTG